MNRKEVRFSPMVNRKTGESIIKGKTISHEDESKITKTQVMMNKFLKAGADGFLEVITEIKEELENRPTDQMHIDTYCIMCDLIKKYKNYG